MQRLLLLVIFCFSLCYCSLVELQKEWDGWKERNAKIYTTRQEEGSRWNVWRENYRKIKEHNKANHSFVLELNQFADLTQEEFARFYLSVPRDASEFPRSGLIHQPLEKEDGESDDDDSGGVGSGGIDWRERGYVTYVKNQGQCGSCWAFSATGALEGQMYRKRQKLISLSEQQLLDCSWSYGNAGCNGGLMDYAFKYVKNNGGICSANAYQYVGYVQDCKSNQCSSVAYCNGYTDIKSGSEDNLASAVSSYGPVSVAIDASSYQFQFYSSGVYYDSSCSSSKLNHGVLVVGYGSYNNIGYWIVKNSWGSSWGKYGYIKMAKGQNNMCGIASAASYPNV